MGRIAIVTDTNSGITEQLASELDVKLVTMPFVVDGTEYFENVTCTHEQFYDMLKAGKDVSTSQPAPYSHTSLWDELLKEYDEIIYIPMSSALSSTCSTAKSLAQNYNDKVFVADNKRISVSQLSSVLDAIYLKDNGNSAAEICRKLEETAFDCSIYLAVNTLELLKKSGRVTPAGATLATILGLKPVLQIQGEKLDAYAKVRGMANAEKTMLEAAKNDLENRFKGKNTKLYVAYSCNEEQAKEWTDKVKSYFNDDTIEMFRLPISICCHVGAGVKAIGVMNPLA